MLEPFTDRKDSGSDVEIAGPSDVEEANLTTAFSTDVGTELPGLTEDNDQAADAAQSATGLTNEQEIEYLKTLQDAFETKRTLRKRPENLNYSERRTARPNADASLEPSASEGEGNDKQPRAKKFKASGGRAPKKAYVREEEVEEQVAWHVGLNANALSEEEEELLPPHVITRQHTYIKVRNHVLARWRADVTKYITAEDAALKIGPKHKDLVPYAWDFLNLFGYINFGARLPAHPLSGSNGSTESIIVVGAGLAGVSAACQLHRWGYKVVILEGRNRPGGRVYTARLEGGGHSGVADLGGSIVTGINGNPLAVLARQLDIPMHRIADRCPLYLEGGQEPHQEVDQLAMKQHDDVLDKCDTYRNDMGEVADMISLGTALDTLWGDLPKLEDEAHQQLRHQLMHWHMANVEFSNAACLNTLSLRHWDQDDSYEMYGDHVFLPGGNLRLVEGLLANVPIFYNSVVEHIQYGDEAEVVVHSSTGTFKADAVVVTAPLGVLKRGTIRFEPPLPEEKQTAIHRLGYGVLNKLVLLFPYVFWDDTCDTFGHVSTAEDPSERGMFYLFYQYSGLAGGAVLAALVAGEAAIKFEQIPEKQAVTNIMKVLRDIHEPRGIKVPDPVQALCTRWGSDPLSFGSYSSMAVGSVGADDYDAMAATVSGRLFFAGEATIKKWPATMHGAFISGLREAAKVVQAFRENRKAQQGKARAGLAAAKKAPQKQTADTVDTDEPSSSDSDNSSDDEDYHSGPRQRRRQPRAGSPSADSNGSTKDRVAAELETGTQLARQGAALQGLFKEDPDMEFGCFSAFMVPPSTSSTAPGGSQEASSPQRSRQALVRIDMGSMRNGPHACVHMVLPQAQLATLRDVRGGNEARLAVLAGEMGAKLLGRQAPDKELQAALEAIAAARGLTIELLADKGDAGSEGATAAPVV